MLRPATPLTILLLAAFVLLLISVLSAPIIKSFPLGQFDGVNFGVFGYCDGNKCSDFGVGYNPEQAFEDKNAEKNFSLPMATRKSLSVILIIHPIAAFFTLVMLILAGASHMHSPSHSPRYLLGIFILSILTLVLALLSFLIDVLLFVPHMAWGSYIVLAATVLIAASGIVSCAMRRTLVSRKARKKRIAENAEMNGENYYNRQAAVPAPSISPVVGQGGNDKLPSFATFEQESRAKETGGMGENEMDDRIPLTTRTRSPEVEGTAMVGSQGREQDPLHRYASNPSLQGSAVGSQSGYRGADGQGPRRDQYGNIIPPVRGQSPGQGYGQGPMRGDPRNGYPAGPGAGGYGRGRGGGPGFRGRGGGPGYGRGGYDGPGGLGPYDQGERGDRGMNPMAAGAMGAMAGGAMGALAGRGGRGPPPGYRNDNGYGQGGGGRDQYSNRAQSPADGYGGAGMEYDDQARSGSVPPHQQGGDYGVAYGGGMGGDGLARAESPPPMDEQQGLPVGQAIEMDATTGARSPIHSPVQASSGRDAYGNDTDVQGMAGLQQQPQRTVVSDGSKYSNDVDAYVPPRQQWNQSPGGTSSPLASNLPQNPSRSGTSNSNRHGRQNSADTYYEDVDPRFVQPGTEPTALPTVSELPNNNTNSSLPASLTPGFGAAGVPGGYHGTSVPLQQRENLNARGAPMGLDGSNSYEDLHNHHGSRSPSESERSNFTSVSQRGVNPRWPGNQQPQNMPQPRGFPGYGPQGGRRGPPRNEMLLESNPDFQLPGMGPRARGPVNRVQGQGQQGRFSPAMGGPQGHVPRSAYDTPGGAV